MNTRCNAPAKLILCGEHAVLYDSPALCMAIDLPTSCELTHNTVTQGFDIELTDLNLHRFLDKSQWQAQADSIEQRYRLFQSGRLEIDAVLQTPIDLIVICLLHFDRHTPLASGQWTIKITSKAPIGRGLGSSAAVIIALLKGLFQHHRLNVDPPTLLTLAKTCEAYQHGTSSGIDPATLIYGGLLRYRLLQGSPRIESLPAKAPQAWLIDTGRPSSMTGDCVQQVKASHGQQPALWQHFAQVCSDIEQAWLNGDVDRLKQALRENQQLLVEIGVVPIPVQALIERLEQTLDGAAKLCGAGSISGDAGGILLFVGHQSPAPLCQKIGLPCWPLQIQAQGAHCDPN